MLVIDLYAFFFLVFFFLVFHRLDAMFMSVEIL